MSSNGGCIPANADVSGIGIRLSIYVTTLIIAMIPNVEATAELRGALTTAAGLNGFALLITALIDTANRSLTLFHAIIIMHMLSFLGIATNPVGSYRATPARLILYWVTTWVVFTLLLCWIVYVWVTAPTFGAASVCNDATIYVILFVNVRATIGWLRWFFVTVAAITLFVMLYMPLFAILALWNLGTHREVRGENANSTAGASDANALELGVIPSHARSGVEPRRIAGPSDITTPRSRMATEIPHPPPRRAFTALSTVSDNKMFFSPQTSSGRGLLGRVLTAVYGVTMLELTIKRNRNNIGGDEGVWTFGQIVAMLVTAGSLNEVFHFILAEEDRGKKKRGIIEYLTSHRTRSTTPETPAQGQQSPHAQGSYMDKP